jgi:Protein of unknown function (DUF2637)
VRNGNGSTAGSGRPNRGDSFLRYATAAAVLLVAAIAAVISFIHIRELAVTHGQTPLAAVLLPFSIDGTVVAASLVLLRAARAGIAAPWLAQVMLLSSVLATLAANVAYGAASGVAGALISGWPAYAFIGCAEMAIMMVRRVTRVVPDTVSVAPFTDAQTAAADALRRTLAAGNPLSQNQMQAQFRLSRAEASIVRQRVTAGSNGHGHG